MSTLPRLGFDAARPYDLPPAVEPFDVPLHDANPGPAANPYGPPPAQPWQAPAPADRTPGHQGALTVGWVLFGLGIAVNLYIGGLAVFFGLLSLVFSTWAEASLLMVPLVMIPSTIVQLVRLVGRKPSLILGAVVIAAPCLALLLWQWTFTP